MFKINVKDLINELKSELSGNLEECLLAMMEPKHLYDAKCLRRAMRVNHFAILCSKKCSDQSFPGHAPCSYLLGTTNFFGVSADLIVQ